VASERSSDRGSIPRASMGNGKRETGNVLKGRFPFFMPVTTKDLVDKPGRVDV